MIPTPPRLSGERSFDPSLHPLPQTTGNSSPFVVVRVQFLPFGRGGPVYHLEYILTPVVCAYGFVLNEISCLSQVSSKLRKDPFEVEVNVTQLGSIHSALS
jgi:hypothetical protein